MMNDGGTFSNLGEFSLHVPRSTTGHISAELPDITPCLKRFGCGRVAVETGSKSLVCRGNRIKPSSPHVGVPV